ncbi:hypothetical protein F750_1450 [Streptomyces sp. PAMC 26508]|nr:hypothetical protein F750_1450 [Streptomyces sp. PAMC 26508]
MHQRAPGSSLTGLLGQPVDHPEAVQQGALHEIVRARRRQGRRWLRRARYGRHVEDPTARHRHPAAYHRPQSSHTA